MLREFFDQYLLVSEILDAGTAVLFIRPHHEHALLARLEKRLAIDNALLVPAFAVAALSRSEKTLVPRREKISCSSSKISLSMLLPLKIGFAFFEERSHALLRIVRVTQHFLQFGLEFETTRPVVVHCRTHHFFGRGNR